MPRENDEAAKKLDMTSHLSHHLCVSSRSLPFSPRFNRRTADGARALHNTEVILRRAAGENKAIIRRIRRTFSQVALRLSCERCFDAGKRCFLIAPDEFDPAYASSLECARSGRRAPRRGDESARCRDVCSRVASERMHMFHKY